MITVLYNVIVHQAFHLPADECVCIVCGTEAGKPLAVSSIVNRFPILRISVSLPAAELCDGIMVQPYILYSRPAAITSPHIIPLLGERITCFV